MTRAKLSFGRRLALLSAVAVALALVLGLAATFTLQRRQLRGAIDDGLKRQTSRVEVSGDITRAVPVSPGGRSAVTKQLLRLDAPRLEFGDAPTFYELVVIAPGKRNPSTSGSPLPVSARVLQVARAGHGSYFTDANFRAKHLRVRVLALGRGRAVIAARSLEDVDAALLRLAWNLVVTGLLGVGVAAAAGFAVARGALRPVRELTQVVERVSATTALDDRIRVQGGDELARLGAAFNRMLESLSSAKTAQRELVANASHELRTPLTTLQTNIDVLRQGALTDEKEKERLLATVGDEIDDLTKLVANLVELARGAQRVAHQETVKLDELVETVVARAAVRYREIAFSVVRSPTQVLGAREDLERAIWNLIENAAKWTGAERRIEIAVSGGEVTVRDWGRGVRREDSAHIFERFYRADTARGTPGSGLGLAIVRQIAEQHGGAVSVEAPTDGGALFRLVLIEVP